MATISKRKGKTGTTYQVKIRMKGFPPVSASFDTLAEAKKWETETEAAMLGGRWKDTKNEAKITFNELLDKYIEKECIGGTHYRDPGQQRRRAESFRSMFPDFCSMYAINIHPHHIADIRDRLASQQGRKEGQSKSPSTVNNRISLISKVFDLASSEWGFPDLQNPVARIRRMSVNDAREKRIPDETISCILSHMTLEGQNITKLLLLTAMRRSEVCFLDWSFVNLQEKTIFLPRGYSKNKEPREVPIFPAVNEILISLGPKETGRVFLLRPDSLTSMFLKAVKLAGLTDIRLHDLRHEAASRLSETGLFNIVELSEMGGWKTLQLLRRYIKPKGKTMAEKIK